MKISSTEIANIVDAIKVTGNFNLSNYCIDTRYLQKGDIFIALKGNKSDGHNFINQALAKGASGLIISEEFFVKNVAISYPNFIVVKDPLEALTKIARYNRLQSKATFIGITGSIGKTSLKEMLYFLLDQEIIVDKTFRNYNNHIGLPFSLAHIREKAKAGIFEMGMSAKGEISYLSEILRPNIAVITEVSSAHMEFFNSEIEVAYAKMEIMDFMMKNSIIFLNQDNQYFPIMLRKAKETEMKVFTFSFVGNKKANILVIDTKVTTKNTTMVKASIFGEIVNFEISSIFNHHCVLMSVALSIAKVLNFNLHTVISKTKNFTIPKGRGLISNINIRQDGNKQIRCMLVDDSYNASPKSMFALIDSASLIIGDKILILGDMLELGGISEDEHKKLQDVISKHKFKKILLLGKEMLVLKNLNKSREDILHFFNYQDLYKFLVGIVSENDVIMIKGSFGSNTHKVVELLQLNI